MKIYNTLTRRKEEFKPIEDGFVKIYVCGPTVYNFFHIGNARPFVVFDTLRKYLEYRGYKVKFVQNFTDVDDKIINKAREEGVTAPEISEKYIEEYYKDAAALNVKKADVHPKVSEHIPEIIDFVSTLVDKGYAYEVNGDVYFSTRKFDGYGKLSRQNIEDLEAGARIAVGDIKKDPLDFALWKAQKEPDEIAWDSPWGKGRPGWHIECSAMSKKHLGDTIDIHAGGQDLQFPHHENEIAQYESAHHETFSNYWMHNGFININNQKMSKSLGNFFTVRDITAQYDPMVLRFYMLSAHYRNPLNFSKELMDAAKTSLDRIYTALDRLRELSAKAQGDAMTEKELEDQKAVDQLQETFNSKMDDDLNTADAITAIFELVRVANITATEESTKAYVDYVLAKLELLMGVLGIRTELKKDDLDSEVEKLIEERQAARKAKDFARADEIRDQLLAMGIVLKDTREGVKWSRA